MRIVPVVALQILLKIAARDIGRVTDI